MRMGIYSSGGIMGIKSRDLWKIVITIHPEHVEFTLIHQQKYKKNGDSTVVPKFTFTSTVLQS